MTGDDGTEEGPGAVPPEIARAVTLSLIERLDDAHARYASPTGTGGPTRGEGWADATRFLRLIADEHTDAIGDGMGKVTR